MSKRQIIILLGALIIIIALFSGLPTSWNTILYVLIGLTIITVAYTTSKPAQNQLKKAFSAPFVDTKKVEIPLVPPLTVSADVQE